MQVDPLAINTGVKAPQTDTIYAWYVLGMLVFAYTLHWIDRYLFIITMESIKQDLDISDTQLGLLSGLAFSLVYSISGMFLARFSDLGSRRLIIACGVGLWSIMTAACGLAHSFWHLFIARFGVGIGESSSSPPAHSLISDYFTQKKRATALAIYGLGLYFGLSTGLSVGGWLNEYYGWRIAFFAAGIPGVFFALLFSLTVREPLRGHADHGNIDANHYSVKEVTRFMLKKRSFVAYVLGSGIFVFGGNSIDSWAAVFLMRVHGMGSAEVGAKIGAIGGIAGIVGTMVFAVIADRLSTRDLRWYLWVSAIGGTLCVPASLLFLFTDGDMMFVYYFIGIMFGASYMAPTFAITQRIMPLRMRAVSSAVILLSYNLVGMAAGNFTTGLLSDLLAPVYHEESIRYALALATMVALIGFGLTIYGANHLKRDFPDLR